MKYKLINEQTYSDWIEQVLHNRGLTDREIHLYLNPYESLEHDWRELSHIGDAAYQVAMAIAQQKKVYVQVDCDCDGYTSAAALLNYLWSLFPATIENNWTWGLHANKEHGIEIEAVKALIPSGLHMVIAPDSSSNEHDIHKELLNDWNIKTIVLDHHEAAPDAEDPAYIVNNQMCNYPNKTLSGVGIVYKFCEAFDEMFGFNNHIQILDLVALGMIGDMMDMRSLETRYLITEGLAYPQNPYFTGMLMKQQYQLQDNFTPFNIAFYVVPYINAITRVGTQEEKELIFQALLDFKAHNLIVSTKRGDPPGTMTELVTQAVRVCGNVKARQEREKKAVIDQLDDMIINNRLTDYPVIICEMKEPIDANLTGLVANYVMAKYGKPTLILNWRDDHWAGSGRAFPIAEVENWRNFFENDCSVIYAQGHANAFGIAMTAEQLQELKQQMNTWFFVITPIHDVDFVFSAKSELLVHCIKRLTERGDLWGQGVSEPEICVEHVKINAKQIHLFSPDKKPTIRFDLPHNIAGMIFNTTQTAYDKLVSMIPEMGAIELRIIGKASLNNYNGNITQQIIISDYEVTNVIDLDF